MKDLSFHQLGGKGKWDIVCDKSSHYYIPPGQTEWIQNILFIAKMELLIALKISIPKAGYLISISCKTELWSCQLPSSWRRGNPPQCEWLVGTFYSCVVWKDENTMFACLRVNEYRMKSAGLLSFTNTHPQHIHHCTLWTHYYCEYYCEGMLIPYHHQQRKSTHTNVQTNTTTSERNSATNVWVFHNHHFVLNFLQTCFSIFRLNKFSWLRTLNTVSILSETTSEFTSITSCTYY